MQQLLFSCIVPLCMVLLTRPNASVPQLSFVGLLAWYGIAIFALVGVLNPQLSYVGLNYLVDCLVY